MEPEATILMYSPRWRDQVEVCRLVSEALPFGYTLLVKENPKMLGARPKGYYEQLKRFPNVQLVSTKVPSAALIERARSVVSLAGTITLEARLRGKQAFCFGLPPFHPFATATGAAILDELSSSSLEISDFEDDWKGWVRSTFPGRANRHRFHPSMAQSILDDSRENVSGYLSFICGVLSGMQRCSLMV